MSKLAHLGNRINLDKAAISLTWIKPKGLVVHLEISREWVARETHACDRVLCSARVLRR